MRERRAPFPATQWSLILTAGGHGEGSREALEALLRAYWPPLFAFACRQGCGPDVAQDVVQGFLARLLERGDLTRVDPERGRFRSYLLAGLQHYLISQVRHEKAAKRGPMMVVPLEAGAVAREARLVPDGELSPEVVFDRRWARRVLERAMDRLQSEQEARGKGDWYRALKAGLAGDEGQDYGRLAVELGSSPGAVAVAVHRLRKRLRELVRLEVSQTVGSAEDLELEMRHLMEVWNG